MTNQFESAQVESSQVGDAANLGVAAGTAAESAANSFRQLVESDNIEKSGTIVTNQDNFITRDEVNKMGDSKKAEQLPNLEIDQAQENKEDWKKEQGENNSIFDGKDEGRIKEPGDKYGTQGAEISNRLEDFFKKHEREVSDKDRNKAKEILSDELSPLVPKADQKALKAMQSALIDGDVEAFGKAVKEASSDPEKLKMLVKELNNQLTENEGFGGIDVHVSGGNVYMYEEGGDTALKIDSETGKASIHPIERRGDGSVVMTPGEIINREPSDVMQSVADEATRSMTGKSLFGIHKGDKFPMPKPRPPLFDGDIKPFYDKPGQGKGGGGGGKGHEGQKWDFLKRGALGAMKSIEE